MYDAIVIGAGHNGLAAAIHLASRGWKVAVVEKAAEPGGAVKTREVTLPGFRHDLCAMNLSMFAGSPFLAAYKNDLGRHGLEFVSAEKAFATAFADGGWIGVQTGLGLTAGGSCKISEHDALAWQALGREFASEAEYIFGLLNARMPSWTLLRVLWKARRALGTQGLLDLIGTIVSTPRDFLDARFDDPKLKAMMAVWALHLDFAPDTAGGALFSYLQAMSGQQAGMTLGKGGADAIINAMVSLLKERGGHLILGSAVEEIGLAGGEAASVRLAGGQVLEADRAIVANLHPKLVFGNLLAGSGNAGFDKGVSRYRAAPGSLMVHLALKELPAWTAAELGEFAYVHLAPDMAMMGRAYAEAAAGLLPGEPVIVVGQPTVVDSGRAPAGRHVLWIQVRVLPGEIRGDAAGRIDGRDWNTVKEVYADRVIDVISKYAPGLGDSVLGRAVFSPLDLELENASLLQGDSVTGSHRLDQNFLLRPVPGWSRYKTPVKNLYLCGASTWPGAGTGAGSGFMLGRMLAG